MAIVENISTEYGDKLIIRADVPIVGLIFLTDFIDDVEGVDANNTFNKRFRYATDGINFTDWIELTIDNLNEVNVEATDAFVIEYEYEHTGSGGVGDVAFNSVEVNGEFQAPPPTPTYNNSIFGELFDMNDPEVLGWCINVTEKLYKKGIVPAYIERGAESNINRIDRDYLDFWRTVACFFAYIVILGRRVGDFRNRPEQFIDFLRQRNIFLCQNTTPEDLTYITENYFDEVRQRGTAEIYKKKGTGGKPVDGELLRLICFEDEADDFIFNLHLPHTIGWSVDNSSPLYKGLQRQVGANKSYEKFKDITDLSLYPTINEGSLSIVTDGEKSVLSSSSVTAGIGAINFNQAINVDDNLSYEISFFVKKNSAGSQFDFGVSAFDQFNNAKSTLRIDTGVAEDRFVENIVLPLSDKYYFIRGIIYARDVNNTEVDNDLTIGEGKHLKMAENTFKIIPYIVGDVRIWGLSIKPLGTSYSTGFALPKNFISLWLKNRNGELSNLQVESVIRKFLLPYSSSFKINYLPLDDANAIGDFSAADFNDDYFI